MTLTREEAIQLLQEKIDDRPLFKDEREAFELAIEALSQPIVAKHFDIQSGYIYCSPQDAENVKVVVRCKDCKDSRVYGKTTRWLACESVMEGQATDPDGYCYLGEKREESEVDE